MTRERSFLAALWAFLLTALAARLWGVGAGLPYLYHPDEPTNLVVIDRLAAGATLNPQFFNYPSLFFYLQAAAQVLLRLGGTLAGVWDRGVALGPQVQAMGDGFLAHPSVLVLGRTLTVAASVATCGLAALLTRRLSGSRGAALLTAALLALSPLAIENAPLVTPDTYAALFTLGALAAALGVLRAPGRRSYLLAGAAVGLAASVKYNAALVAVAVVVAHLFNGFPPASEGGLAARLRVWLGPLVLAGAAGALIFALCTPYALLTPRAFVHDLLAESSHYASGHPGHEGAALAALLGALGSSEGLALALAGAALLGTSLRREALVLSIFTCAYLLFLGAFTVHFSRNLLPLLPALAVLAGLGAAALAQRARERLPRRLAAVCVAAVLLALAAPRVWWMAGWAGAQRFDERAAARAWLAAHVRPGSALLVEGYAPWTLPGAFALTTVPFVGESAGIDLTAIDAVLLTSRGSGRFLAAPERYPREAARLEALRRRSCHRARVENRSYWLEVLVLRCGALR